MTDRVRTLLVHLEADTRTDDAQVLVDAIRCLRGVAQVEIGPANTSSDYIQRETVRREIWQQLLALVRKET